MSAPITYCNSCGGIYPLQVVSRCPDCASSDVENETGDYDNDQDFDAAIDEFD